MNNDPIQLQNVWRSYKDGPAVVHDLNLSVKKGSIYGFLGRNGSGKTTTLRMLAGLTRPDAGEVRVLGWDPYFAGAEARQEIGYMAEKGMIPPDLKVGALLKLGRALYPKWDIPLVDSLVSKYNLLPHHSFKSLSEGRRQLLAFLMAIAPRPKVLLLDEPAAHLDLVARREILDLILDLILESGSTVLFSTHLLSDIERVADEIGILAEGNMRISEPLDILKDSIRQVRFFGFKEELPEEDLPESFRTLRSQNELTVTFRISPHCTPETVAERWSCRYETRHLSLEDIFVELTHLSSTYE